MDRLDLSALPVVGLPRPTGHDAEHARDPRRRPTAAECCWAASPTHRPGPPTATGRTRRPSPVWPRRDGSNAARPRLPLRRARRPAGRRDARAPRAVRLAVGGHPACLDRCGGAGGQGYAPDTHLQAGHRPRAGDGGRRRRARGARPLGGGRASLWRPTARPRRSAPLPRAHAGRRRADVRVARGSWRCPKRRRGGVRVGLRHRGRPAGHG